MIPKKTPHTQKIIGILLAVISAACLIAGVILFVTSCGSGEKKQDEVPSSTGATIQSVPASTAKPTAASAAETTSGSSAPSYSEETADTEHTTAQDTGVPSEMPEDLLGFLSEAGYNQNTLVSLHASQLIVVDSSGTSAEIHFYEQSDGKWKEDESLMCQGYVGVEGTVTEMSEQTSGTPKGVYPVGSAFYQDDAPQTGLEAFHITNETYWVDDPDSAFYNQRVEGTEQMDWISAERMSDISGYRYGFVINYNMPPEYNKGSAIFFHIGYNPTEGCIATSEEMVLAYLSRLKTESNPCILVI